MDIVRVKQIYHNAKLILFRESLNADYVRLEPVPDAPKIPIKRQNNDPNRKSFRQQFEEAQKKKEDNNVCKEIVKRFNCH